MTEKRQCAERVASEGPWGSFHQHPCGSPATVKANGKDWCWRHSPAGKAKADKAQQTRWDEKAAALNRRLDSMKETRRRATVYEQMLTALKELLAEVERNEGAGDMRGSIDTAPAYAAIKAAEKGQ